mmetsp:Transcript_84557/g.149642  ORF Transcript_84557/g.149642 Transcript_84557/m.149642 type:complete len:240 (-) Transcript_84557:202-921(-)
MAQGRTRAAIRAIGHLLGALVNAALISQSVVLFTQPATGDIITFCHWLGQGLTFGLVGVIGMAIEFAMEFRMQTDGFMKSFMKAMAHRTLLGIYYFWLGCCAIGGLRATMTTVEGKNHSWQLVDASVSLRLAEVTIGYCAWTAAAFNLLTSCCFGETGHEKEDDDEEKVALINSKAKGKRSTSSLSTTCQSETSSFQTQDGRSSFKSPEVISEKPEVSSDLFEAPAGGWAHMDKPFGCA